MTKTNDKFTIGSDPELMFVRNGFPVSAIEPFQERDKYNKFEDDETSTALYHDNILLEGNVAPATSPDEFVNNIGGLFKHFRKLFPKDGLRAQASYTFTTKDCKHEKAKEFGCDPENCVDMRREVRPPNSKDAKTFRSAGGHIHIGMLESKFLEDLENKVYAIKLMDLYVGVPMVIMDNDETSLDRKKLYGKAGRFRFTPYGVEYRTPSNFWVSTPELTKLIAELTFWVMNEADSGRSEELLSFVERNAVIDCINNHNKDSALEILNSIPMPEEFKAQILELGKQAHKPEVLENW